MDTENKEMLQQEELSAQATVQPTENEEEKVVTEANEAEVDTPATEEPNTQEKAEAPLTREAIIAEFSNLLNEDFEHIKERAEQLKTLFFRLNKQQKEAAQSKLEELKATVETEKQELQAEAAVTDQVIDEAFDELEEQFRALWDSYKQRKQEIHEKLEKELADNQLRKENIIAQMKELSESETAEVGDKLQKVRELQQEWKSIGAVSPVVASSLWKQYNLYQEKFYDLVKINNELREYDFRKNLEAKTALCVEAEALNEEEDVIVAFRKLQDLHQEWVNIGPVARELREDLWNRFKAASTVINKRHQDHFDALHQKEDENLAKKQDLIKLLEEIDTADFTTNAEWDAATEKVNQIQTEWRQIGFAPKKFNQQIYAQYRELCNKFFDAKNDFYLQLRAVRQDNLQLKRKLVAEVEALQNSTEWKETSEKLIDIQKRWKEIGAVPKKYGDDLWKRFQDACDHFFNEKKAAQKGKRAEESENLEQKQQIVKQIEELAVTTKEETLQQLRELNQKFNSIGYVPFRDKDKLYKRLRAATDKIFDSLHVEAENRRLDDFERKVEQKDENGLMQERKHLLHQYENLEQEIKTAENNILFFAANSKKGNKIVDDMQKSIDEQKRRLHEIEQKIELIDKKL